MLNIDLEKDLNEAEATPHTTMPSGEGTKTSNKDNLWGDNDFHRPQNWSIAKKSINLVIVGAFRFLSPLASTIITPVSPDILSSFHMQSDILTSFVVSSFLLGYVAGPLVISPLSEIYGRLPLYHINSSLFVIWTIACALAPTLPALIVFRILAGVAGSCPVTLGNGSLSDCVRAEKRGFVLSLYALGPIVGPVMGPLIGGFLGKATGWRWTFWLVALIAGPLTVLSFVFQRETYEKVLLARSRRWSHPTSDTNSKSHSLMKNMMRPLRMLFKSPVIFVASLYTGLIYGTMYLLFTSFPIVYQRVYGFDEGTIGLTYLSFGIGCSVGLVIFGRYSDRMVQLFSTDGEWQPEYRLLPLFPGSFFVPIGLLWYGWSVQAHLQWIMPMIGTGIVGFGVLAVFMPVQSYLTDAFAPYSASAIAANTVLRSLAGAVLPLAGSHLYRALGYGWGNTLLAMLALLFTPMSLLVYRYGARYRRFSD